MRDGLRVIDCDAHVMEPDSLWVNYIDKKYRDRAPRKIVDNGRIWGQLQVDGEPIFFNYPDRLVEVYQQNVVANYEEFHRNGFDAASQVRALDQQGIDIAYLYPSVGLYVTSIDGQDPDLAYAISRAYNDWISDFCSYAPDRLKPVAMLSRHRPVDAEQELRRVVKELGMRAVTVRPNPINGKTIAHQDFEPFWTLCEELDVAIGIHEGSHVRLRATGQDRFTTHLGMHAACHPMEQMMAFISLFEGGVFERHPRLRFAFLEAGCGWLPYLLWRMEMEFKLWKYQVPDVHRTPKECFQTQCYINAEGGEPYLPALLDSIGDGKILFASDYPHPDHELGEELEEVLELKLSLEVKKKILWDNAASFYGIPRAAAQQQ
jgi:predicted TIM-barrel fold metal-dependent hydrolase